MRRVRRRLTPRFAANLAVLLILASLPALFPRPWAVTAWHLRQPARAGLTAAFAGWTWFPWRPLVVVPVVECPFDRDRDGVSDLDAIVLGARAEAARHTVYRDRYYRDGYPPDGEGVCMDVVWRAFKRAGYDLKAMMDADVAANPAIYPRVGGEPDPNIDFRRVPNLVVFLDRFATKMTIEAIPGNAANLTLWQRGDIVIFGRAAEHVGVVSNRRRRDGVPLLIHNNGPFATEEDGLLTQKWPIVAHYRFPR